MVIAIISSASAVCISGGMDGLTITYGTLGLIVTGNFPFSFSKRTLLLLGALSVLSTSIGFCISSGNIVGFNTFLIGFFGIKNPSSSIGFIPLEVGTNPVALGAVVVVGVVGNDGVEGIPTGVGGNEGFTFGVGIAGVVGIELNGLVVGVRGFIRFFLCQKNQLARHFSGWFWFWAEDMF